MYLKIHITWVATTNGIHAKAAYAFIRLYVAVADTQTADNISLVEKDDLPISELKIDAAMKSKTNEYCVSSNVSVCVEQF